MQKIENVVNAWWKRCVCNSPVSRSTEAFNHLQSVLPELKQAVQEITDSGGKHRKSEVNHDVT